MRSPFAVHAALWNILFQIALTLVPSFTQAQAPSFQYLYPPPGARWVRPQTELMVRTGRPITPFELAWLEQSSVVGSSSGPHALRVRSADEGTLALISLPVGLTPGETVTVRYGPENGGRAERTGGEHTYTFEVAAGLSVASDGASDVRPAEASGAKAGLPADYPPMRIETFGSVYDGRIFLAPLVSSTRMLILERYGADFYHSPSSGTRIQDFGPVNDTLLYYGVTGADPYFLLADAGMQVLDTVRCGNGYTIDLHDFIYKPNGHKVLMSYDPQIVDMSVVVPGGNPAATVIGLVLQELDAQDNVVFQWRSWDHFQITDAQSVGALPFNFTQNNLDYVHGNSIDVLPNGDLLISGRHTNEVTRIDRATGAVIWRMGGSHNMFTFINDPFNGFHSQHDARMLPNGHLTIFDNGLGHTPQRSRVVEYAIDEQAHTATLVWSYYNPANQPTVISGNAQRLPNGNTFINWCNPLTNVNQHTMLEEVDPSGNPVFRLYVPDTSAFEWSYRAYRYAWPSHSGESTVRVSPKVLLEGPYDGAGGMTDGLRAAGLLPGTQPYTAQGYAFVGSPGAGGAVSAGVFGVTGSNAIVDWVVVELREAGTPAHVVASCAALVQRDGDVVALDGTSPVSMEVAPGNYHVAIRHRNHLGAMTANALALGGTATSVDLTTAVLATFGTDAQRSIGGINVLWNGDVTFNHQLRYTGTGNDRDPILVRVGGTTPNNALSGYYPEDTNLDGLVKYTGSGNDRDRILVGVGGASPNNTRTEQLP